MPEVAVELRNIAGTEAALGWAGAHTIVVDRPDGRAGGKGLGFNGSQLLALTIGGCFCNDLRYVAALARATTGRRIRHVNGEIGFLVRLIVVMIVALLGVTQRVVAQSGHQIINGTQVYTVIDRSRGVATFSNDCGSQTLTQGQLQAGAIPDQIIPCPRGSGNGASCAPGHVPTRAGTCMKAGHVDCGNGRSCPPGTYCTGGNSCGSIVAKRAADAEDEGRRKLKAKDYVGARAAFRRAADNWGRAGSSGAKEYAERQAREASCLLQLEKATTDDEPKDCSEFSYHFAEYDRRRREANQEKWQRELPAENARLDACIAEADKLKDDAAALRAFAKSKKCAEFPLFITRLGWDADEAEKRAAASKAAPASSASAASTPPPASSGPRQPWDGTREKCHLAGNVDRNTAAYYVMCVEPNAPKRSGHKPNPDPLALGKQARDVCGSYSRDTQACFSGFKLKVILQSNPGLRETCEKAAEQKGSGLRATLRARLGTREDTTQRFRECVDNIYLYGGLDRSLDQTRRSLRDQLREAMDAKAAVEAGDPYPVGENAPRSVFCGTNQRCCPTGYGMKPTPGAFGAWSCQALGLLSLKKPQPRLSTEEADEIADFEDRVGQLAANAVADVIASYGVGLSESDRRTCTTAALSAAYAMLKSGGNVDVSAQCLTIADAARMAVVRHADAYVDNSNTAVDDLLANFRFDLGKPLPGFVGLEPDEQQRRFIDCVARTGSAASCN